MSVKQEQSYFWHDYETSGTDPRRDRPMQFAGVRTDADFNLIEDPVVLYCKPADDMLPHPEACLITGITPQKALEAGLVEAEFIGQILKELARPHTCSVGYNSIRFDDELTRNTLYRNFFDPYAREWQNGCSRWDIIDMLRLTRALRPDGIVWPTYPDGTPSLRLEDLTKANGIDHGNAHDALSDVFATLEMAKLVKRVQPKLFDYVLNNRSKQAVQQLLDTRRMKPVLHASSKYPAAQGNLAIVAPLASHPVNSNATAIWDLRLDPSPLSELSVDELRSLLYTPDQDRPAGSPKLGLKLVHANRCPILAPAGMLSSTEAEKFDIDGQVCRTHLGMLRNSPGLADKVKAIYLDEHETNPDPDLALYSGGFFSPTDRKLMNRIIESDPSSLGALQLPFQDARLEEMFLRYRARNYPETLSTEDQYRWEEYRVQKLLKGESGYLSIPELYENLNRLASDPKLSDSGRHILEELAIYAESICPVQLD